MGALRLYKVFSYGAALLIQSGQAEYVWSVEVSTELLLIGRQSSG